MAVTAIATGSSLNSATVTLSETPEPGDLLVAVCELVTATASTWTADTGTGWTGVGPTGFSRLFYRLAVEGDGATYAFTPTGGYSNRGIAIASFRGVDPSAPVSDAAWDTGFTTDAITGVVAGSWVLAAFSAQVTDTDVTGDTFTEPAGTTEAVAALSARDFPNNGVAVAIAYDPSVSAGTYPSLTGDFTAATAAATANNWYTLAITEEVLTVEGTTGANAGDRLRSNLSETTGSLLEAVDVRAVDASVSEAYSLAQELTPATLTIYREMLRARDSATADFAYYPRPRQNSVMENQYEGVTVLSRLATYYPDRVFDSVDADGLNIDETRGFAYAQEVLTYMLTTWAADVGWLTFEPVPDLRLRLANFAPTDYDTGADPKMGVVTTETVVFPQDRANRKSALDILKALLSPFPGTILRQNSTGALEIVPTYGPDADATPAVTLDTNDVYGVTIGNPDPFSITNRATVSAAGYSRSSDVECMQPAWFQVGGRVQFGRSNWYTPPVDRVNLQPFTHATATTYQETLATTDAFNLQKPILWPISTERIAAGTGISLVDSVGDPLITHSWARYFNDSLVDSGSEAGNLTIVTEVIPFDSDDWVIAFQFDRVIGGEPVDLDVKARWNDTLQGIEFAFGPRINLETDRSTGTNGVIIEFTLNDASVGYAETGTVTGTFGFVDDGDNLPATDGGNAITDSQTEYGILEASIDIDGYVLDAVTLKDIAQGYVLQNITPKVVRELDLSTIGTRLVFDHIGSLVALPNTEEGRVIGRSYSDDFVARAWRATAQVEVANPLGIGALDTTTTYLLNSDATYWENDDGTFTEAP